VHCVPREHATPSGCAPFAASSVHCMEAAQCFAGAQSVSVLHVIAHNPVVPLQIPSRHCAAVTHDCRLGWPHVPSELQTPFAHWLSRVQLTPPGFAPFAASATHAAPLHQAVVAHARSPAGSFEPQVDEHVPDLHPPGPRHSAVDPHATVSGTPHLPSVWHLPLWHCAPRSHDVAGAGAAPFGASS
jgi:hypothetical protein